MQYTVLCSIKMPNYVTFVNSHNRLVDDPVGIEVVAAARQPQGMYTNFASHKVYILILPATRYAY